MSMSPPPRPGTVTSPLVSILWFASSNFFRQGIAAATTLLRPVLMTPDLFGLFTALRLVPTYADYMHLGARDSMRYLIPLYEARGEYQRIQELRATVLTSSVVGAVCLALLLFALALFSDWGPAERIGLAICASAVVLDAFYNHFFTELKGFQAFKEVGINNYLNAVAQLVFNAVLILSWGFYGALVAQSGTVIVLLIYMAWRGHSHRRWGLNLGVLKSAILLGGPSMLFDLALLMMRSTDRLVIVHFLGYQELGYYGLGAMVMGYLLHIPGATREVMEARLFQNHGDDSPTVAFLEFVVRPMVMVGLTMPILIGPVVLFLPVFIPWLLPAYKAGVSSTQILMLGGYFLAVSFPIRGILAAYGWQIWGAAMILGSVALHVAMSIALIKLGLGIDGVAISAGISFAAAGLALFLLVIARLPERPPGVLRQGLLAMLPFPLMLAVLFAAVRFGEWLAWPVWPTLFAQLGLYGLALLLGAALAAWAGLIPLAGLRRHLS